MKTNPQIQKYYYEEEPQLHDICQERFIYSKAICLSLLFFIKPMQECQTHHYRYITVRRQPQFQELLARGWESLQKLDQKEVFCAAILRADQEVQKIFTCIQEHRAQGLEAGERGEKILIYISDVSFPQLTIVSVEVLPRVHMPQLQKLWLEGNKISTLQPLRKAELPQLNILFISDNELREFNGLQQANLPYIEELLIETYYSQTGPQQDVSCLLKLSTNSIKTLYVSRQNRIGQSTTRRQLQAKYPAIKIRHHQS